MGPNERTCELVRGPWGTLLPRFATFAVLTPRSHDTHSSFSFMILNQLKNCLVQSLSVSMALLRVTAGSFIVFFCIYVETAFKDDPLLLCLYSRGGFDSLGAFTSQRLRNWTVEL